MNIITNNTNLLVITKAFKVALIAKNLFACLGHNHGITLKVFLVQLCCHTIH